MSYAVYARVSTDQQTLDQQIARCRALATAKGLEVGHVFAESVSSGADSRPEWQRCLGALRRYEYNGLIVFKLDRIARRLVELVLTIDELEGKSIKVLSVEDSFDTSTPAGRAMFQLICVFAEFERSQLREATRSRLAALKAQGVRLGRPTRASRVLQTRILQMAGKGMSLGEIATAIGPVKAGLKRGAELLSPSTISRIIRNGGKVNGNGAPSPDPGAQNHPGTARPGRRDQGRYQGAGGLALEVR